MIELKAGERVILGDCSVTNPGQRVRLYVEGSVPILREKEVMTTELADTPCKRIYLAVQAMYLSKFPAEQHEEYVRIAREVVRELPGTRRYIEDINRCIASASLYKALKCARSLTDYEQKNPAPARAAE
jgi:flagellar biosynthesis repressor protein FlbT